MGRLGCWRLCPRSDAKPLHRRRQAMHRLLPSSQLAPPLFAGHSYPLNKVSSSRRLMNLFHVNPLVGVPVGAPLTAGMTGVSGESFADLLDN